jgi:hypothetical protein
VARLTRSTTCACQPESPTVARLTRSTTCACQPESPTVAGQPLPALNAQAVTVLRVSLIPFQPGPGPFHVPLTTPRLGWQPSSQPGPPKMTRTEAAGPGTKTQSLSGAARENIMLRAAGYPASPVLASESLSRRTRLAVLSWPRPLLAAGPTSG